MPIAYLKDKKATNFYFCLSKEVNILKQEEPAWSPY